MRKIMRNVYFLKIENSKIVNQGLFTKISKYGADGYFFSFLTGNKSDEFNCNNEFINKCIFFDSDYEMRNFIEKVKSGKVDPSFELSKQLSLEDYTKKKILFLYHKLKLSDDFEVRMALSDIIVSNLW